MEALAEVVADPDMKETLASQTIENRSHIAMGRRIVEEFVEKPVEMEMCRWACAVARQDYRRYLHETSDFVLQRQTPAPPIVAGAGDGLRERIMSLKGDHERCTKAGCATSSAASSTSTRLSRWSRCTGSRSISTPALIPAARRA